MMYSQRLLLVAFFATLLILVSCKNDKTNTNSTPTNTTVDHTNTETPPPTPQPNRTTANKEKPFVMVGDFMCIPGERVGEINAQTTEADLKRIYGEQYVKRDTIISEVKGDIPITILFAGMPHELQIVWNLDSLFTKIERVIIQKKGTKWHTSSGISIGTPLSQVVKLNDADFYLYSFGNSYAGSVSTWEGGRFEGEKMTMRFNHQANLKTLSTDSVSVAFGEEEINSSEPILEKMQVEVEQLFFFF